MKYYSTETPFKNYSWEQMMVAVWQRYPNPFSPHVLTEDTLERRVDGGRLYTKRILMKTNPLPKWGQRFVHMREVAIIEESILDRDQRIFLTYTRNIGLTNTMNVIEKCIYTPASEESATSPAILKRQAWIHSSVRGFASVLQRFGIERYKHNANKATKGLLFTLGKLFPSHPATPHVKSKLLQPTTVVTDLIAHQVEHATAKAGASAL